MGNTKKLYKHLNEIPLPETKLFVNIEFNDALVKMREKIDKAKDNGVDTTENEEIMERLTVCWGVVNSIYTQNELYYSKLTILNAAVAKLKEEVSSISKENETLKKELDERFDS